jgi:hypothetical protein
MNQTKLYNTICMEYKISYGPSNMSSCCAYNYSVHEHKICAGPTLTLPCLAHLGKDDRGECGRWGLGDDLNCISNVFWVDLQNFTGYPCALFRLDCQSTLVQKHASSQLVRCVI